MKNKTLVLTRAMLKNGGGLGFSLKSKWSWALLVLLVVWSIPVVLYGYVQMIAFAYQSLAMIGQEGVLLSWGLVISSFMVFFFGIFHVLSSFYFANDIEHYLPMPIRPRQIVGAKFFVIVLYEYLLIAFVFLPILIFFGIQQGCGVLYYVYGLIGLIFVPILPLALATLLVMLIMRVTNLTRYRELLKIIGGTVAILLGISISLLMQRFADVTPEQISELLLSGNHSLAILQTRVFPTVKWAVQALLNYEIAAGLTNLLVFAGLSGLLFAALLFLAELVYFKGVIGISESSSRRYAVRKGSLDRLVKKRSAIISYLLLEIRLLIRTPVYFLNCVLSNFLWPLILIFSFVVAPSDGDVSGLLGYAKGAINDPGLAGIALGIILAVFAFMSGSNGVAATAISREGQDLYIKHYLPISYRDQIVAKLLSSVVVGYSGVVSLTVPLAVLFGVPLYFTVITLALAFLPLALTSMSGLLLDLLNPKLEWDSEQKAVKQNLNVVFNILFSTVLAGIMVAVTVKLRLNLAWTLVVLPLLLLAACIGLYRLLVTYGGSSFRALEG